MVVFLAPPELAEREATGSSASSRGWPYGGPTLRKSQLAVRHPGGLLGITAAKGAVSQEEKRQQGQALRQHERRFGLSRRQNREGRILGESLGDEDEYIEIKRGDGADDIGAPPPSDQPRPEIGMEGDREKGQRDDPDDMGRRQLAEREQKAGRARDEGRHKEDRIRRRESPAGEKAADDDEPGGDREKADDDVESSLAFKAKDHCFLPR